MPLSEQPPAGDLDDLFEHAPCGYAVLDARARIVRANATLLEWLDCDSERVLGLRIHEILGTGGQIAYETHIGPLLRIQGFAHEIALDLRPAEGALIPVIANASEQREPDGSHRLTRLTLFRAADRRAYENDLLQARFRAEAEAERREQEAVLREQFIAVLGHDLRNPLAAITVGASMLGRDSALGERSATVSAEIGKAASRALKLVEDVMDFARGRLGSGLPIDLQSCETLGRTISDVLAEVRRVHPENRFEIDIAIEQPVTCDESRIAQLVSNLVANAVHHGEPDKPIAVAARTHGGTLSIEVTNRGEPIPEAVRENLFEPFCRGDMLRDRKGLGLGLYIVNEIATAHGGQVEVTSQDGKTSFRFEMPLGADASPEAESGD